MDALNCRRNLANVIRTTSNVVSVAAMSKQNNDYDGTITHCDEMSRVREWRGEMERGKADGNRKRRGLREMGRERE